MCGGAGFSLCSHLAYTFKLPHVYIMALVEDMWRQLAELRLHRATVAAMAHTQRVDMVAWEAAARRATCLCPVCGQTLKGGLAGYEQHRRQSARCRKSKSFILRQLGRATQKPAPGELPPRPLAVEVVSTSLAAWVGSLDPKKPGAVGSAGVRGQTLRPAGGETSPFHLLCGVREPHVPLKVVPRPAGQRGPIRYII